MIIQASANGFHVTGYDDVSVLSVDVGGLNHDEFVRAVSASPDVSMHEIPRHLWVSVSLLARLLGTENDPQRAAELSDLVRSAVAGGWASEDGTRVGAAILIPDA